MSWVIPLFFTLSTTRSVAQIRSLPNIGYSSFGKCAFTLFRAHATVSLLAGKWLMTASFGRGFI